MQTPIDFRFLKPAAAIFAVSLLFAFLLPVFASVESTAPKPVPTTTANPEIPVKELQYRLVPLTKDELAALAEEWLQIVKAKTEEIIKALSGNLPNVRIAGWAGARRATVGRPAVTAAASPASARRGSTSVSGPGQCASASARATSENLA